MADVAAAGGETGYGGAGDLERAAVEEEAGGGGTRLLVGVDAQRAGGEGRSAGVGIGGGKVECAVPSFVLAAAGAVGGQVGVEKTVVEPGDRQRWADRVAAHAGDDDSVDVPGGVERGVGGAAAAGAVGERDGGGLVKTVVGSAVVIVGVGSQLPVGFWNAWVMVIALPWVSIVPPPA